MIKVEVAEQIVIGHLRARGLLAEGPIPLMNCERCVHGDEREVGHCYMFDVKPEGQHCAQFRKE